MRIKQIVLTSLCLLTLHSPVRTDFNPLAAIGIVTAAVVAVGTGYMWGASRTENYYNSVEAKAQATQKERTTIQNSEETLERIKREAHQLLHTHASYQSITDLLVHAGTQGFGSFEMNMRTQLTLIQAQKRELSEVTGSHGPESQELGKRARELASSYQEIEQHHQSWHYITQQIHTQRQEPLAQIEHIRPFITQLAQHAISDDPLMSHLNKTYGSAQSRDGVRGVPLICATEDLGSYQEKIMSHNNTLHQHRSLVTRDPDVDSALQTTHSWYLRLQGMLQAINNNPQFKKEVSEYHIRREMILRAQAEKDTAAAQKAREEADRARAITDQEKATAERERAEADRLRAQTNAVHAVSNAMETVTNAVLHGITGHHCPHHHCDYYNCPHNCHHRRDYIEVYVIRR